ncbi:MAG: PAS domain S-box protein, partial [Deltaproteobacteria bacterium]
MSDEMRSTKELVRELQELRQRIQELERNSAEPRQTDEALREVEERYRKVFEASSDGILVTEDGVIVEADDRIAEIVRRDPAELVGLQFKELIQEENDRKAEGQVLDGNQEVVEVELIRKDGMPVLVELSTKGASDRDSATVTAVRDLTQVKAVEEKAAETEERFRAIFEAAPEVIYLKDSDLKLTHVNPAMETLFGLAASELLGSREEDLYGEQTAQQIRKWDSRALDGHIVEEEHTRTVNGEPRTFLDIRVPLRTMTNEIFGVCCISRDITDYKRTVP